MRTNIIKLLGGVATLSVPLCLNAIPFTGSIQFVGGATVNSSITAITGYSDALGDPSTEPQVLGGSQTGIYAGVAAGTAAVWSPFTFNPPAASVSPLWTMTYNGVTYSFDATSMVVVSATANFVSITGDGIAHVTGYDDTDGTWSITTTSQGGLNFDFGASSTAQTGGSVPDGGTTVLLLGGALSVLAVFRRKLA